MISGDEYDALSKKAKNYLHWKPGERKKIKRGYNKRLRKCAYDGGELGSTDVWENVELPVGDDRKSSKTIDANENFALAA